MVNNWIEGANPFKLPQPSSWWLQLLKDYDAQLVLMPSVKDCCYRLCRRVAVQDRLGLKVAAIHTHPDTVQMINHGLIPVRTVIPWAVKSDKIIRDLMACDITAQGGAEKVDKAINDAERYDAERLDRQQSQEAFERSGDAYRSLKRMKGESVSLGDVNRGRGPVRSKLERLWRDTIRKPASPGGIVLTDS